MKKSPFKYEDLRVDTFRPAGANFTFWSTAVRITHIPTGTTVTCDTEKSYRLNQDKAIDMLIEKLNGLRRT